jgi:hypothetical protein
MMSLNDAFGDALIKGKDFAKMRWWLLTARRNV